MAQGRPESLTSVSEAFNNFRDGPPPQINLMGIVVDILSPTQNQKTNDWQMTFTIQDPDMVKILRPPKGLKARFFVTNKEDLPAINSIGDVILIRNCRVIPVFGAPMIVNFKGRGGTGTVVFPAATIPEEAFKQSFLGGGKELNCVCHPPNMRPNTNEQMYAIHLKKEFAPVLVPSRPSVNAIAGPSTSASIPTGLARSKGGPPVKGKNKLRWISDAQYGNYCDLVVEVVKKYPTSNGTVELYVTDYTTNDLLFDYPQPNQKNDDEDDYLYRDGDQYGHIPSITGKRKQWPGPFGKRTLTVELMSPHAEVARAKVKEGDFVVLENVRIKQSQLNKMEGNIWPDTKYQNKVLIHGVRGMKEHAQDNMKIVMKRRAEYWAKYDRTKKNQQEKKNKKKKKSKPDKDDSNDSNPRPNPISENPYVSCSHPDYDPTSLADMASFNRTYKGSSGCEWNLPFVNRQRRVTVRVVDFAPLRLEDFTRLEQPAEVSGEVSEDEMDLDAPSQKWEWDFFLLLEDTKPRQPNSAPTQEWVHVEHKDAEFLLSMDEDATDLRQNPGTLAKLREKLAILWGNLEELKTAARVKNQPYPPPTPEQGSELSNLPFTCCIREEARELDPEDVESDASDGFPTFLRIYGMFGTTIRC